MASEREAARAALQEAGSRAQALAAEVVSLESALLQAKSSALKAERNAEDKSGTVGGLAWAGGLGQVAAEWVVTRADVCAIPPHRLMCCTSFVMLCLTCGHPAVRAQTSKLEKRLAAALKEAASFNEEVRLPVAFALPLLTYSCGSLTY